MEIKHTIEILTKDIQDIENLVRNLKNYPEPPQIELDLAMSKLRRVYELIYMISNDRKVEVDTLAAERNAGVVDNIDEESPTNEDSGPAEEKQETVIAEKMAPLEEETPVVETEIMDEGEEAPVTEEAGPTETEEDLVEEEAGLAEAEETPMAEEDDQAEVETEIPSTEAVTVTEETLPFEEEIPTKSETVVVEEDNVPEAESSEKKDGAILAEKFSKDTSLNEKIAGAKDADVGTSIKGGAIDSIKRNIGINDRFLIIRELMNGDNEGFNQLLLKLDECNNFNEAFKNIESRFPDNLEHEGVKILINLSRRKFISSGNV